ncbi:DEAD/DEAH box helicase [bacterium]|nr:DEAD/DEAH box helicase [bacterium]
MSAEGARSTLALDFDRGTLLLRPLEGERGEPILPEEVRAALFSLGAREDERVHALRLPAYRYAALVLELRALGVPLEDRARAYEQLERLPAPAREPRSYQAEALAAWKKASRRGVVVLPTGSGKTFLAVLAIRDAARSALVCVPTIDLLHQWYSVLAASFPGTEIGALGAGQLVVRDLTVATYDSAYLHLDRFGARFGLAIFDEAHHLPGATFSLAATLAIAPFRLGLTATPERTDGGEAVLSDLVGPIVYRREIKELSGEHLAPYELVSIQVELSEDERSRYEGARGRFRSFVDSRRIRLGGKDGWRRFLIESSRDSEGREAFASWREQRRIALATPRKLEVLEGIISRHCGRPAGLPPNPPSPLLGEGVEGRGSGADRILVFTDENDAAYEVSRRFLVPAITHQTKPRERRAFLEAFASGRFPVLATSRVLNEGVDVPAASVAVVLSGSATVREHVQRLGRILRPAPGKLAILYEVVSSGTSEESASARRRQHDAYR